MPLQTLFGMHTGAHRNLTSTGVGCHLHVILGIAHHQRFLRGHVKALHDVQQHLRVRLGWRLVGTARGMEDMGQLKTRIEAFIEQLEER